MVQAGKGIAPGGREISSSCFRPPNPKLHYAGTPAKQHARVDLRELSVAKREQGTNAAGTRGGENMQQKGLGTT